MTSLAERVQNGASGLAARYGITRALVFSVLGRVWSVLAGPLTLIVIGRFLTREEQGFYYTFWSILGLWLFFELGLGIVIVQFASHERASLRLEDGRMTGDARAHERLASLFHLAVRWYGFASILMMLVVFPLGMIFFSRYRADATGVNWVLPWTLVVLTSTLNFLLGPLTSVLEGSGLLRDVALMRLLQAMTANVFLWIALPAGLRLYGAVVHNGVFALFAATWLLTRHRRFFRDLLSVRPRQHRIRWREEIWPFQWRFAVSWMTGYVMFQIFNPIVFAVEGPRAAGQMGMSLMITTAIALFAQAWISTRAVDYGALVASRNFTLLDRMFRVTLVQSMTVVLALSCAFLVAMEVLRHIGHPLATRVLPPLPLMLLILATLLYQIIGVQAWYLRAWKREPFLAIYAPMCAVTAAGSLLVAKSFGVTGMMWVLVISVAIGVGGGTYVFVTRRRQWRETSDGSADVDEVGERLA